MAASDRSLAMVRLLGGLLLLFAPTFLLPLGWSVWLDDGHWQAFASGAGASDRNRSDDIHDLGGT